MGDVTLLARAVALALILPTVAAVAIVAPQPAIAATDIAQPDSEADASHLVEADARDAEDAASGAGAPSGRSFQARLSAYSHGTRTASGTPVRWGVVAVDPRVIPLGSRLTIEGFDTVFVAEDTGGAVRGNHIDIYFPDLAAAIRFGVQTRTVTVLN